MRHRSAAARPNRPLSLPPFGAVGWYLAAQANPNQRQDTRLCDDSPIDASLDHVDLALRRGGRSKRLLALLRWAFVRLHRRPKPSLRGD